MPSNDKLIRIILKLQDDMSAPIAKAASNVEKLGNTLTSVGTKMTAAITLPLVAAGAAGVNMAMDLDKAMRNIQSVGGQTDTQLAKLSDTFIDMSTDITKTTDSAQNLAEAFYDIQGSGFEGADAMKVLEVATMAASAGLTTTAIAAEGITATLNSYGQTADDAAYFSNLMFATVDRGVGSFEELTGSLANVTGVASSMGVNFDEVSAAIATMSKQGQSFATATTNLNGVLNGFLKPSEAMKSAIAEMGYESGQAMIDTLGLAGSMQALDEFTGGSTEAMAALFGDIRGLRGALALTGTGAELFAEDLAAMGDVAGRTAEAFAIQTKSFDAVWKNFQNTLNALLIEVGQVIIPVLSEFLQNIIIPMIQWFRELPEPVQKVIIGFAAFLAVLGPILVIAGQLIGAISAIGAALPAIGAALAFLLSPIGLIIGALALLFLAWQTNFLGIQDLVNGFVQFMGEAWMVLTGQWVDSENPIIWWLKELVYNFENFVKILQNPVQALKDMLYTLITGDFASGIWNEDTWITSWLISIHKAIVNFIPTIQKLGSDMMQGLVNGVKGKALEFIKVVRDMAMGAANAIRSALGIHSPSKVMAKLGRNVVEGFNQGVETMGGLGVNVPTVNGTSISGSNPTLAMSGSGGGYGGIVIQNLNVPAGTSQEQVEFLMKELGKRIKQRGGRGI